ncbi:MAG: triose-phosphate isomerase [Candidatus Magasanikbacteria bacterium]|nr:triose-phosphate isomerase [Candidatus Magasanikbacteria bacterium]
MNETKKLYLFANWKMYLGLEASYVLAKNIKEELANLNNGITMAVFPSTLALASVAAELKSTTIKVGAQNVYWVPEGGYTGEVSAEMFAATGAEYALIGHSERRHQCHETNHEVRQKIEAALTAGLTPVICIGETASEREAGSTAEVIETQLRSALGALAWRDGLPLLIAYEPVWAISRGVNKPGGHCSAVEAGKMHAVVEKIARELTGIAPAVLYGGSVRPETIAEYLATPHIAGVLVGAAATKFSSWSEITAAAVEAWR